MQKEKVHIQLAGIRNVEEALMCVECGVDIIGLLVGQKHTSKDFISRELAKKIKDSLPQEIQTTLITHLEDAESIIEIAKFINVDNIQLHSSIKESEVKIIKEKLPDKKIIRIIHISEDGRILTSVKDIEVVDYYFTDSINLKTNQVGGTGLLHNFETDKSLVKKLNKPVFIAGGLNPENVFVAVDYCKPFGVDVNTGCRAQNGLRDINKVKEFVKNARI